MTKFSEIKFKEILKQIGLSQRDFAICSKLSYSTVTKICAGVQKNASISTLIYCASILNCSISDFLEIDNDGYKRTEIPKKQLEYINLLENNKELRELINTTKNLTKEELITITVLVKKILF